MELPKQLDLHGRGWDTRTQKVEVRANKSLYYNFYKFLKILNKVSSYLYYN